MRMPAGQLKYVARFFAVLTGHLALGFLLVATASGPQALAQTVTPPLMPASASAKPLTVLKTSSKPTWQDLTPAQQQSLKPLAANWSILGDAQKRKWIAIAAGYPNLAPAEQVKMHGRMTEWVALSQKQRTEARLNFAQSKQLTPTQKTETWQAYQALSAEDKQKLASSAPPMQTSAATPAKSNQSEKLAIVPVNPHSSKQAPHIATARHTVNQATLLPKPPVAPASAPKN
jgi:hypothetical protein